MPTHSGPNTTAESSIIFSYDTGDVLNSYKGQPTINLINNPLPTSTTSYSTSGGTMEYDSTEQAVRYTITSGSYASWGAYHFNNSTYYTAFDTGSYYTVSFEWKFGPLHTADTSIYFNIVQGNGQNTVFGNYTLISNSTLQPNGWYKFTKTQIPYNQGYPQTGQLPGFRIITGNKGANVTDIFWRKLQLEKLPNVTPFIDGTRSATQGLLPLIGNASIDLSNVSFDSNAQITFDGTDDIINTNIFSGRNPSTDPFTIEALVKSDITSGTRMWVDAGSNGTNQRFYSSLIDGTTSATGIQSTGWSDSIPNHTNWSHQVIVMDGQNAKAYADGIFKYQIGYTSYTLPGGLNIGGRSGYPWLGQIPIFKVYDRALSDLEVKQNYNQYKSRFNLS
jgi:hypothetical protein